MVDESQAEDFWESPSIEQLAERQRVLPVQSLDDLAGDWPADDSLDDFLEAVRQGRM